MEVPGGRWIIPDKGSQGAKIALFGKRE